MLQWRVTSFPTPRGKSYILEVGIPSDVEEAGNDMR